MLFSKPANTYFLVYRFKSREVPSKVAIYQVLTKKAVS